MCKITGSERWSQGSNLVLPDFKTVGGHIVAQGLEPTAAGRSCWELDSFTSRGAVSAAPVREVCEQQLDSICQACGLDQGDGFQTWLCIETFAGLLKAQVPGPHSRWASVLLTRSQEQLEARLALACRAL